MQHVNNSQQLSIRPSTLDKYSFKWHLMCPFLKEIKEVCDCQGLWMLLPLCPFSSKQEEYSSLVWQTHQARDMGGVTARLPW